MMYPIKFNTILKEILWGGSEICKFKQLPEQRDGIGESWEISQVKDNVSVVENGEYKGLTLTDMIQRFGADFLGKHVYERFGEKFPLLIKFIDARDNLSIQVHPDDRLAAERHNSFGKTEMWYVIAAQEGAGLYSGFSARITPEEYVERVNDNTIMEVLQFHPVKSGDVFFLPAGRVHAIGKGIFIAEIQQTSDITYRIYDYNRKDASGKGRELHTQLAKDAIDYKLYDDLKTAYTPQPNTPVDLVSCNYFVTNLLDLTAGIERPVSDKDSFVIYICMEGSAAVTDNNGNRIEVKQGETILVPAAVASVSFEVKAGAKLLECYIPCC
ncbi:MAG: class I mannose-6-phosphate isomerase [Coprobacter sp.]|nr:class I mannose-6-phosphate isomerase [Coprobacter sp.]